MGAFRSQPALKIDSLTLEDSTWKATSSHMCGWRLYMEDADIMSLPLKNKEHYLFGVFDGHGGAEVSTYVARHFQQILEANENYKSDRFEKALTETFLAIDQKMLKQGKAEIQKIQKQMRERQNGPKYEQASNAGCTANVVLITKQWTYCANAGDSRAVAAFKSNKTAEELSVDHKPQDPIELERIKRAGGTVSNGRVNGGLNLSRALGDFDYKKGHHLQAHEQMISPLPDIKRVKTQLIDFIIMGCDGIWEVKSNQEMVDWIRDAGNISAQEILDKLLNLLVSKDSANQFGMDNMSAILIRRLK